jgi:thioredoxin 1
MADMLAFTTQNFEQEVLKADGLVLVDFYATWCTHCKRLDTVLRSFGDTYVGRVKMGKVDVYVQQPLPQQYRIHNTPTVLFFRNGQEVARLAGSGAREHVKERLDQLLAAPAA